MRLIDAEALKDIEYINKGNFNSVEGIWKWIDDAPTVDISTYASKQRAYKEGKYDGFMSAPYGDD